MHRYVHRVESSDLDGDHLAFDRILLCFREAWRDFFATLGQGLTPKNLLLRHAEIDFLAAIRGGNLTMDIHVQSIGKRSVVIRFEAIQEQCRAALVATFVNIHPVTSAPTGFTERQASALEAHTQQPQAHKG